MRTRLARLVLVLLLVPVVILAGPAAPGAQAATTYGPVAVADFGFRSGIGGSAETSCSTRAQWVFDGFMQTIQAKNSCHVGWAAAAAGYMQYDVKLMFRGNSVGNGTTTGAVCQFASERTDETSISDTFTITARQGVLWDFFQGPTPPTVSKCNVSEFCWSFKYDTNFFEDFEKSGCEALNVGYPPDPPSETAPDGCTWGKVLGKPVFNGAPRYVYLDRNVYAQSVTVRVESLVSAPQTWMSYAVLSSPGTSNVEPAGTRVTDPAQSVTVPVRFQEKGEKTANGNVVTEMTFEVEVSRKWFNSADTPVPTGPAAGVTVQGFGVYAPNYPNWTSSSNGYLENFHSQRSTPQAKLNTTGSSVGNGRWGVTDASKCSFYWGPKVASFPAAGNVTDEPIGNLGTTTPVQPGNPAADDQEPAPLPSEDSACGFSVTDPSTWLEGGMCAAVGLLGELLGVIGDVLQAVLGLVPALTNMLTTLLVPSPSSWGMSGLVDQIKARPPFSVAKDVTDAGTTFGQSFNTGTCGQLIDMGDFMDGRADVGCEQVKSTPSYGVGYNLITWALYLFTGLGVFRMVAANLGDQS